MATTRSSGEAAIAPRQMGRSLRFLSPAWHGVIDYAAAGGLFGLPFVLGLGRGNPIALWLSIAGGVGLVLYSLLTDYRYGVVGAVSFRGHLRLDAAAAATFLVAPFLLRFDALATAYYVANGLAVLGVVAVSDPAGGTATHE